MPLSLYRLYIEHFVCLAKSIAFIKRPAFICGMKGDNAYLSAARLSQNTFNQMAGQFAPAVLCFNVDIEQISALRRVRVKGMRRPVEQQKPCPGDDFAVVFGEPAKVLTFIDHSRNPGLKVLRHHLKRWRIPTSSVDEHTVAMAGDCGGVGCVGCCASQAYVSQYKTIGWFS